MGARAYRNFKFAALGLPQDPAIMREIGNRVAIKIVNRTLSGLDENNRPFKPYSPNYRKPFGKGTVDLMVTGEMLNDLGVTSVSARRVEIGFASPAMATRAAYHDGPRYTSHVPRRKFLGVPDDWVSEIIAKIRERLGR